MPVSRLPLLALLLAGCTEGVSVGDKPGTGGHGDDDDDSGATDTADTADTGDAAIDCDDIVGQEPTTTILPDFSGSEDYAFDHDGYVVHVTDYGGLVRENLAGDSEVIATNLGTASGIRVLPDGSYAVNSVDRGAILRIQPTGEVETLVSGLAYPNGLELGLDGWLYVAENSGSAVRRVNPETGEAELVARGLSQPNGVSFNPDYTTLYVGSFGAGVIYAIDLQDDGTWAEPRIHGVAPGVEIPQDDCVDLAAGDACWLVDGGYGACVPQSDDALECEWEPDTTGCANLEEDAACTTVVYGETVDGTCRVSAWDDALYCSSIDAERLDACEGGTAWGECTFTAGRGYCEPSWEGPLACITSREYEQAYTVGCTDLAEGDACEIADPVMPQRGVCADMGGPQLYCSPPGWTGAGFDGMTADVCGNVYTTEYGPGIVWRWPAEPEQEPEELLDMRAAWIPNMHWGLGVGGFERTHLYIIRRSGGMIDVPIGVEGKPDAYDVLHTP